MVRMILTVLFASLSQAYYMNVHQSADSNGICVGPALKSVTQDAGACVSVLGSKFFLQTNDTDPSAEFFTAAQFHDANCSTPVSQPGQHLYGASVPLKGGDGCLVIDEFAPAGQCGGFPSACCQSDNTAADCIGACQTTLCPVNCTQAVLQDAATECGVTSCLESIAGDLVDCKMACPDDDVQCNKNCGFNVLAQLPLCYEGDRKPTGRMLVK